MLGTKKNCLALPLTAIYDAYIKNIVYPEADENGKAISASTAPNHYLYAPLLNRISSDAELQTQFRVIEVTDKNAVKELCIDILKTAKDLGIKEEITTENLSRAFDFFDMKVLTDKSRKNLSSRVKAEAFMQLMLNPNKVQTDYTSDVLGNKIFSGSMNFNDNVIDVEEQRFNSFANLFALKNHSRIDEKKLTEITDRLIEDTDRRRKGDFYTPTIWVNEAHKLMSKHLGDDWKQKCIVWDCAWGTGNLTRDYKFSDLYCSTIMEEDLKIGEKYNPFATKFQYDFLNDDVDLFEMAQNALWEPFIGTGYAYHKNLKPKVNFCDILDLYAEAELRNIIPEGSGIAAYTKAISILHQSKLHLGCIESKEGTTGKSLIDELLESSQAGENGRPLVFFINPPYGTSGEITSANGKEKKSGIADTAINMMMKEERIGPSSQQLYAQFLYRIKTLQKLFGVNVTVGVFSPTLLMTGKQFKGLREYTGEFIDGYLIQASNFADVKANWAIAFTAWDYNKKHSKDEFKLTAFVDGTEDELFRAVDKELYIPKNTASDWAKEIKPSGRQIETFTMSNAIKVTDGTCKISENSLGVALMNQNIVESNLQFVMILPRKLKGHLSSFDITKDNFDRIMSLYTARKLIIPTWINWQDEYMVPNTEHPDYAQWQADCIVYSLFNGKSQQSSLRNIEYNGKTWNIFNEFFWMSREEIYELATGAKRQDTLAPAVADDVLKYGQSGNRFVYEKLQTVHLSDDAKFILDFATAILIDTMKYREAFNLKHPEYHINSWDAGWYQIKALAKEYTPDTLKMFNEHYKVFEDRMRPLVYELCFLYE